MSALTPRPGAPSTSLQRLHHVEKVRSCGSIACSLLGILCSRRRRTLTCACASVLRQPIVVKIRCSFVTENCSHSGACWWRDGGVGQGRRTSIGGCFSSMSRVYASCEGLPPHSALSTGCSLNGVALTIF